MRSSAPAVVARHKRHSDVELYRVLVVGMELVEVCLAEESELKVLNGLIAKLPLVNGNKRQYIEHSSDIYQRVCRFLFHGEQHSANTNRYAHALREASFLGVRSDKLMERLGNGGGVNQFYLRRPSQRTRQNVSTRCLHLVRPITHDMRHSITLKLKRGVNGFYEVLEVAEGK